MNTIEFLEKCIKSDKLKEKITALGRNDEIWYSIHNMIDEVEDDECDINFAAQEIDAVIWSFKDYESIDDLLENEFLSPEFYKLLKETA